MIQTHKSLLYVIGISLFLQFFNGRGGAYSILLEKVGEGRLLEQGRLLERIRYIEDIQIFVMNMTFISSSEVKNIYFMSGKATNEIHIFFTSLLLGIRVQEGYPDFTI